MRMSIRIGFLSWVLANVFALTSVHAAGQAGPNVVYVLCDDLGYGDVHCYNTEHGKIATPHADELARRGMMFTDAHSGSSVCTPTRYGLLTGRYAWRSPLQHGVVQGFAPCLIAPERPTVEGFLKSKGYTTAIIGKWHLNFQYTDAQTGNALSRKGKTPQVGAVIPDGPTARGFDYFLGFHHAGDMQAVIENDHVIAHDEPVHMLPRLEKKAVEFLDERGRDGKPFFLYVPLNSPHTPIVPSPEWKGKSGLGDYGDYVMQTDSVLGSICAALDRNKLADNTLVIFTSDNGCSKAAGIDKLAKQGHLVSGPLRGSKSDIWDGGHRVPFIVRWPGHVDPGSTCDQTICHTDLFATVAAILGQPLPEAGAEDSVSFLPALSGEKIASTRVGVVHHSISGHFAYRMGDWKLELAYGSGGWSSPGEKQARAQDLPIAQLYNMHDDLGEHHNLYIERPDIADRLLKQLESDVERGRSTDGPKARNDVKGIVLWKSGSDPQDAQDSD
ncbi:MAG: sulfatase-like hydrolase/transferase [Phycisphaera sp.]|nr:sulfatase-like hydrolase/transferase [Phycisphaera sp.]